MNPKDMIKGRWYFILTVNGSPFLFKFDRIEKDRLYDDGVCVDIENRGILRSSNPITDQFSLRKDLREATKEEVEKYFPEEYGSPIKESYEIY